MEAFALWTSAEAAQATSGSTDGFWTAGGVSIDSRSVGFGDLFVALRGPNFDGHVFVADALSNGVAVTPGDAFIVAPGQDPGGVRICLCAEADQRRLETALHTLARLVQTDHGAALAIV